MAFSKIEGWRENGARRHVELRTVASAGHVRPIQRSFRGERALLVRAAAVLSTVTDRVVIIQWLLPIARGPRCSRG